MEFNGKPALSRLKRREFFRMKKDLTNICYVCSALFIYSVIYNALVLVGVKTKVVANAVLGFRLSANLTPYLVRCGKTVLVLNEGSVFESTAQCRACVGYLSYPTG